MNVDDIKKIHSWEKILTWEIKRDILFLIKERSVVSTGQLRKLLYRLNYYGRHKKEGESRPMLTWMAVYNHIKELESVGLISSTTYEPELKTSKSGISSTIGYKLTAEGRDFLNSITRDKI